MKIYVNICDELKEKIRYKEHTRLSLGSGDGHIQSPYFPANLLVAPLACKAAKPGTGLPPFPFKKLDGDPASHAVAPAVRGVRWSRQVLAHQRVDARVDQGFQLYIVDSRECKIENVDGARADRGEITVEEDEIQYALLGGQLAVRL